MTKRPVGLTWIFVLAVDELLGQRLVDHEVDDRLAQLLVLHALVVLRD